MLFSRVLTTVTTLSRLLQVMWDHETSPAPASSLSSRRSCATRTAPAITNRAWWTRLHRGRLVDPQGVQGTAVRQYTVHDLSSDLCYRWVKCLYNGVCTVFFVVVFFYLPPLKHAECLCWPVIESLNKRESPPELPWVTKEGHTLVLQLHTRL